MSNTVQLFVTCLVNSMYPDVGKATVALLERSGFVVEFPLDQTCCGQPAYNGGFEQESLRQVKQTLDVLDATEGPIVVPSGSCAAMIIHHNPELVAEDPVYLEKSKRVAGRTRELSQFLAAATDLDLVGRSEGGSATYHASCHGLRWLQVLNQPKELLSEAGVELIPLKDEDECCGFGGLFSVKMPEVSTAMMDTKIKNIAASGADQVVGVDVSCLMHIGGGLRRQDSEVKAKHIAEVLAEGLL